MKTAIISVRLTEAELARLKKHQTKLDDQHRLKLGISQVARALIMQALDSLDEQERR